MLAIIVQMITKKWLINSNEKLFKEKDIYYHLSCNHYIINESYHFLVHAALYAQILVAFPTIGMYCYLNYD